MPVRCKMPTRVFGRASHAQVGDGVGEVAAPCAPGSASEARPGSAHSSFAVATKLSVLVIFVAATSFGLPDAFLAALSVSSLVYAVCAGERRMAVWFAGFLLFVAVVYFAYTKFGVRPFLLSPMRINQSWQAFPVMVAFFVLIMSPPGLISAALARVRLPKKVILGVLVILRFFPTFAANWRLLYDSMRKRGLLAVRQVLANPLDTYEYLMVPLLMALVKSADQLASSAVTRAAEAPTPRTSYYYRPLGARDGICVVSLAALSLAAVIVGGTML